MLVLSMHPCGILCNSCVLCSAGNVSVVYVSPTRESTGNKVCMSGPFVLPGITFDSPHGPVPQELQPYTQGWQPVLF